MAPLTQKPKLPQRSAHLRSTGSSWMWLALTGGSLAIHALAAILVLPLLGRVAAQTEQLDITAIDFVEVPNPQAVVKPAIASDLAAAVPAPSQPAPAEPTSASDSIAFAPALSPPVAPSIAPSVAALTELPTPLPPEPQSSPEPIAAVPPASSDVAEPLAPASEPAQLAQPSDQVPNQVPNQAPNPSPDLAPDAPLVVTVPIDRAIPNLSDSLPPLQNQPDLLNLIATLQVADVPPEQVETPPPDAIAYPKVLSYRFAPDPQSTVCIPDIDTAKLIQTGAPVAVQVSTDEAGQVMDAALWQPSQNSVNDRLATCLVKNWGWGFEPAIAQGLPVPSKALILWVTIDQPQEN